MAGRPKDHIVEFNGAVYRIGRNNFVKWLSARARGETPTVGAFGGRVVLSIDRSLNDVSTEEASSMLSKLGAEPIAEPTPVEDYLF